MRPVLLVIDIQNVYLPRMDEAEKNRALKVINYIIGMFHSKGFPVIPVFHTDLKFGPETNSEAFKFPEFIKIRAEDPKIIKNYANAFKKTDLGEMLREKEVNTVFLCGLSSCGCVIETYFGALDKDFVTFLLKDALISPKSEYTKMIEEIFKLWVIKH